MVKWKDSSHFLVKGTDCVKRVTLYKQVLDLIMMPNLKENQLFRISLNSEPVRTNLYFWQIPKERLSKSPHRFFYLSNSSYWNHFQYNTGYTPDNSVCFFNIKNTKFLAKTRIVQICYLCITHLWNSIVSFKIWTINSSYTNFSDFVKISQENCFPKYLAENNI